MSALSHVELLCVIFMKGRRTSMFFCLWEIILFIQATMVALLFITFVYLFFFFLTQLPPPHTHCLLHLKMPFFKLASNRRERRCIFPCFILMCTCEVYPLTVATVEFVIFETHSFTKYLGNIWVSSTLLGSGDRAVNKTLFPFVS